MPLWPVVGYDGATQLNGITARYAAFGGDYRDNSTEANAQQELRDSYTVSDYRVYLSSWVGGAGVDDMIASVNKNGSAGNLVLTINATGEHEDNTGTDSFVSGDLINSHFDHSAGGHSDQYTVQTFQVTLDASSDVPPIMGAGEWLVAGAARFNLLLGRARTEATEPTAEYTMRATRVLRDLRVYATTFTSDTSFTVRKNQTDTSLTVTATGTGEFLDTSNIASFVAGDEVTYGSSTGTATISIRSTEADTSSGVQTYGAATVTSVTNYLAPSGGVRGTVEANLQVEAEDSATIQNLFCNCFNYAETRTIRTRKNAANGAASVSVTGAGIFEDLSGQDSLVANDLLSVQQDSGSSGNNSYLVAVEWETSAGGTAHTGVVTMAGTGAAAFIATNAYQATVTMAGAGTAQFAATNAYQAKVALAGVGTMAAIGTASKLGVVAINSAGAAQFGATLGYGGKVAMAGLGASQFAATMGYAAKVAMDGAGTMVALGGLVLGGAAAMNSLGTASFAPGLTLGGVSAMAGSGTLAVAATYGAAARMAAASAAAAQFAATYGAGGKAAMDGAGTMTALGGLALGGAVDLAGVGAMAAIGQAFKGGVAAFDGAGTMSAAGTAEKTGIVALAGVGAAQFAPSLGLGASVAAAGAGSAQFAATHVPSAAPPDEPDRGLRKWLR